MFYVLGLRVAGVASVAFRFVADPVDSPLDALEHYMQCESEEQFLSQSSANWFHAV